MTLLLRLLLAILLGLLAFLLLDATSAALFSRGTPHQIPSWSTSILHGVLLASQLVVPGLIAGSLARFQGWLVGAVVGGLGVLLSALLLQDLIMSGPVSAALISSTTRAVVVGSIAGLAGVALRGQPPNNSFKPNPLRGSA